MCVEWVSFLKSRFLNPILDLALVLGPLSVLVTFIRVFERVRSRKFWVDDAYALLASLFMLIYTVAVSEFIRPAGNS